ncbi:thioredoxin family protein [Sphaerospermopsis torques-reginae]|uniref:Thioredoxin family protein n=1 Tax=Sphaerospermopsis torques-reginae ITEP-024 TaxID=984208 RepID=A0ABX8X472_9CYAN|nr:thioredoxin family protein [Sphaerospermopsis torques-reginae]QYX33419.1 thioredoxin family protein [Sphaerospermopsis torques-reginae ITEP-024]
MSTDAPIKTAVNTPTTTGSSLGGRMRNFLIVIVAIALSAALFLGLRTQTTSVSLTELDAASTPLEVAVSNNKPSLVEFYADWCTVCQKMAPDIAELKQQYADKLNFVMLNVDNNKWLPEMLKYRVDGIPHFVFLGKQGEGIAEAIGDIPRSIMASNLEALVAGSPLPYAQMSGKTSKFSAPVSTNSQDDPRSHGG